MPVRLPLAALAACLVAAGAAPAQDMPRYLPTRDVTVTYQLTASQGGLPPTVTAHITPAGDVRIDTPDRGSVIYDLGSGEADWLMPNSPLYIQLPVKGSLAGTFLPDSGARFTRAGQATVAGMTCTEWHIAAPRGSGSACVTSDGVILRAEGGDTRGARGEIMATNIAYEAQPAALFHPPAGAQRLSMPTRLPKLPRTATP